MITKFSQPVVGGKQLDDLLQYRALGDKHSLTAGSRWQTVTTMVLIVTAVGDMHSTGNSSKQKLHNCTEKASSRPNTFSIDFQCILLQSENILKQQFSPSSSLPSTN